MRNKFCLLQDHHNSSHRTAPQEYLRIGCSGALFHKRATLIIRLWFCPAFEVGQVKDSWSNYRDFTWAFIITADTSKTICSLHITIFLGSFSKTDWRNSRYRESFVRPICWFSVFSNWYVLAALMSHIIFGSFNMWPMAVWSSIPVLAVSIGLHLWQGPLTMQPLLEYSILWLFPVKGINSLAGILIQVHLVLLVHLLPLVHLLNIVPLLPQL